jgi:quinol monooxygenase YgiN
MSYLRMTIATWDVDLDTPAGREMIARIAEEGVAVFRRQPGFIRYRLMRAGPRRAVAVAEWQDESSAVAGAARYREWLAEAGIMAHLTLETDTGPILVSSD